MTDGIASREILRGDKPPRKISREAMR